MSPNHACRPQALGLMVSDKKIFPCFSLYKPMNGDGANFWPQGHNLNKLGRGPQGHVSYKYQGSRPYGFR